MMMMMMMIMTNNTDSEKPAIRGPTFDSRSLDTKDQRGSSLGRPVGILPLAAGALCGAGCAGSGCMTLEKQPKLDTHMDIILISIINIMKKPLIWKPYDIHVDIILM